MNVTSTINLNDSVNNGTLINSSDNNSVISHNNSQIESKLPIVIICCGNGGPFELFHKNHYWLNFYLNKEFNICLWNYRGFGMSTGIPSFKNLKEDSELVYRYLTEMQKYKKIFVHGISLGGIPSCHLAK